MPTILARGRCEAKYSALRPMLAPQSTMRGVSPAASVFSYASRIHANCGAVLMLNSSVWKICSSTAWSLVRSRSQTRPMFSMSTGSSAGEVSAIDCLRWSASSLVGRDLQHRLRQQLHRLRLAGADQHAADVAGLAGGDPGLQAVADACGRADQMAGVHQRIGDGGGGFRLAAGEVEVLHLACGIAEAEPRRIVGVEVLAPGTHAADVE